MTRHQQSHQSNRLSINLLVVNCIYNILCMSGFMETVLKTACTKIAGMFLGNRSDSVHKYDHVVLRVLSTLYTLNRSYTMPMQAFEIAANESNEPNKAKLEFKLIICSNKRKKLSCMPFEARKTNFTVFSWNHECTI